MLTRALDIARSRRDLQGAEALAELIDALRKNRGGAEEDGGGSVGGDSDERPLGEDGEGDQQGYDDEEDLVEDPNAPLPLFNLDIKLKVSCVYQ